MAVINYAIEIETGSELTVSDLGMIDGVMRFITGRPDYDGSPTYPKNEDDTDNTEVWYEGFITKNGIGKATRTVDMTRTGGYGNISSLTFKVRNDGKFWNDLETNGIATIGKTTTLYAVIDDKFYSVWSGVVEKTAYTETEFTFSCKPDFRQKHRMVPPETVGQGKFSTAPSESLGQTIPVSLGELAYSKVIPIQDETAPVALVNNSAGESFSSYAISFVNGGVTSIAPYTVTQPTITLRTDGVNFALDELANGEYYVRVVFGPGQAGDDANTEEMVQIVGNTATTEVTVGLEQIFETKLTLGARITNLSDNSSSALAFSDVVGVTSGPYTWYFTIQRMNIVHVVSNKQIFQFDTDDTGRSRLWYWEADTNKFRERTFLVKDSDTTETSSFGHPNITVDKRRVNIGGEVTLQSFYSPTVSSTSWFSLDAQERGEMIGVIGGIPFGQPLDRMADRNSNSWAQTTITKTCTQLTVRATMPIPQEIIDNNVDSIHLCVFAGILDDGAQDVDYTVNVYQFDPFGLPLSTDVSGGVNETYTSAPATEFIDNPLPAEFWRNGGNAGAFDSVWFKAKNDTQLNFDASLGIKNGYGLPYVQVQISATTSSLSNKTIRIREIGFVGETKIDVAREDVYTRIDGERVDAGESSFDVASSFKHLALNYDDRTSSDIDLGDDTNGGVAYFRGSNSVHRWTVGRQLFDRKSSWEYADELAKQSFVVIYPARDGVLTYRAWRNDETTQLSHDETTIIKDSLRHVGKTLPTEIFNDFEISYQFNPATNGYDRSYFITNLDQATFPGPSSNWTDYVGGIDITGYVEAKELWELCKQSHDRTGLINRLPDNLARLPWFTDRTVYDPEENLGIGTDSAAWRYLVNCVQWLSRERETVGYALPMNATNVTIELAKPVAFSDTILTNGSTRDGWISKITIDPSSDKIMIESVLDPNDGVTAGDFIIETGSQTDTITESGSQTDTITEGA